jgi:hypothetical protein
MMKKEVRGVKGQSAFEYLVTYGWAIILVLVIIGVLAYFGVFNPGQYVPEKCDFGPQLECIDSAINTEGMMVLRFQNNFGDAINITDASSFDFEIDPATTDTSMRIPNGRVDTVSISAVGGFAPNEKVQLNIRIFFRRDYPGSPVHNFTGRLVRKVCTGDFIASPPHINC